MWGLGWWGSGRNIPAPLYSTACPEAKDQGGPFCSESQPRPENQWRERTSLETNTARPADRNKKICESPVNSSCEQCMMQNDTDESKPAFQQSARSKRQAMFRPGSLPPLQTCWASPAGGSTYLGGSDKTGESSQDPARGLLKLPPARDISGHCPARRGSWEGPEDPYGCSCGGEGLSSGCRVTAVSPLALEREALSPRTRQTGSLPAADLAPGRSVSDVCLGRTVACAARVSRACASQMDDAHSVLSRALGSIKTLQRLLANNCYWKYSHCELQRAKHLLVKFPPHQASQLSFFIFYSDSQDSQN